ncbi:MAG: branched-chain amino acid ABC transporter substrate-binding protein [Acidobacteriales bacterium]|nr:branched-chain amino acid ABC transporter substrate-binding protein [Terriglobales bacterium]
MIGCATWSWWIGFHVIAGALLLVDLLLPSHKKDSGPSRKTAWLWTFVLALLAFGFAGFIAVKQGRVTAMEFIAGYTIETSLSVDNLFVFLVIFQGFRLSGGQQHKALAWGVGGAIIMRALFITLGITLIEHFEWVTYVFGALLLYAAWRLVSQHSTRDVIPHWIRNMQPKQGSLLPIIMAVELTDVLFAVDSIPAVLAVSRDPFVVYTSNIAAILGLRSLYFAVASLLDRLRYLHYGLGAMLAFIAFKMLSDHWLDISITISLVTMGAILTICAVWSVLAGPKPEHSKGQ